MSWFHKRILVPPGVKAIVNGKVAPERPLWADPDATVYFVSSAPAILSVFGEAACTEGVVCKIELQVKLSLQDGDLGALTAEAGESTAAASIRTLSAKEVAAHQNVEPALKTGIQTFIQSRSFFDLRKEAAVTPALQSALQDKCRAVQLVCTVEACTELSHRDPPEAKLIDWSAEAAVNPHVAKVLTFFDGLLKEKSQRELTTLSRQKGVEEAIARAKAENEIGIERVKAEAGPALEKLRQQTLTTKTSSTILALQEEHRIKEHEVVLRKQQAEWEQEAIKSNNTILEQRALYEAAYKKRRLEEEALLDQMRVDHELALAKARLDQERDLAALRTDLAKAKETEAETVRRQRQLDLALDLERERTLSAVRLDEYTKMVSQLTGLVEKLVVPVPNYSNVHTLIITPEANPSGSMLTSTLATLLGRVFEGVTPFLGSGERMGDSHANAGNKSGSTI